MWIVVDRDTSTCTRSGAPGRSSVVDPVERALQAPTGDDVATAPMPGTVDHGRGRGRRRRQRGPAARRDREHEDAERDRRDARRRRRPRVPGTSATRSTAVRRSSPSRRSRREQEPDARLESHLDTTSENYRAYREHNLALAEELRETPARAPATCARSGRCDRLAEQNKLTVRQRLDLLLDPGIAVPRADVAGGQPRHYDGEAPQALLVTGIGVVSGREVMVIANDSSLKGGAWYPHLGAQDRARAARSRWRTGSRSCTCSTPAARTCTLQDEIYAWAGHIFQQQCLLSAAGIPQVALVLGYCTAGGAYRRRCATSRSWCASAAASSSPARRSSRPPPART